MALSLKAMEVAKAMFEHSHTFKLVQAEYLEIKPTFRTNIKMTRALYDSGWAALDLMLVDAPAASGKGLRRQRVTAAVGDNRVHFVRWRVCKPHQKPHATTAGSLARFLTIQNLLERLYLRQLEPARSVTSSWFQTQRVTRDGALQMEQLVQATLDGVWRLFSCEAVAMYDLPVVAVAAGVAAPVGITDLNELREALRTQSDKWRKKPGLLGRRSPLWGLLTYCEYE